MTSLKLHTKFQISTEDAEAVVAAGAAAGEDGEINREAVEKWHYINKSDL